MKSLFINAMNKIYVVCETYIYGLSDNRSMKNAMVITGQHMASVENEALKIQDTIRSKGHGCDLYYFNVHQHSKTRVHKYDLAIWWTPFVPMFLSPQRYWLFSQKTNLAVSYYTIEGKIRWWEAHKKWLQWQYVVTPSQFVRDNMEDMGIKVSEIIPHQIPSALPVDHEYGKAWRSRFPSSRKILLYNGSQIIRKGLSNLKYAIERLSAKRDDFLMVYHTDKVKAPFHTTVDELKGKNVVVETDFPHIPLPQAYAKMFYADIIVHPAITEGFGLPVLEALALEKPLVCVNAYGVNEIASPKNSFMVMNTTPYIMPYKGYIAFKVCDYKSSDLAYQIELALDAGKDLLEEKRLVGLETAKRYHNSYDKFADFLG